VVDPVDEPGGAEATEDEPIDALIARLRERVAARTEQGLYPAELDHELDDHFQRIVAHRPAPYDFEELRRRLGHLDEAMGFSPGRIRYESGLPGGPALHRTIGKAVSRQTAGILEQLHRFAEAVRAVLQELAVAIEHPNAHVHAELLGQVDNLMERMAAFDRLPQDGELALVDLRRRLDRLEAAERARRFEPWYSNERFEAAFRGSREALLDRYRDLAAAFTGHAPVVDLGCGRGEFLELLAAAGVEASGVEIDHELVKACRALDLDVAHGDAVEWLASAADGSLGGIALIQVIEHLPLGDRAEVVRLAARKLRPGGRILIETLNPQSLYVFARALYVDPTHDQPVHPAFVDFLLKEAGFGEIAIEWRSPPPDEERLAPDEGTAVGAQNLERLNALLFGPQDYAITATR
jgi:SAM-dependent methyltransferase